MIFHSPHAALHLPPIEETSLPTFLLGPANGSSLERNQEPILFPTPSNSEIASRQHAAPLGLQQIRDLAYRVAYGLISGRLGDGRPFSRGDVIAFYSPNQHDYVPVLLGIHLAGGMAALCNPSYKPNELAHQLRMTQARAILTASSLSIHKSAAAAPSSTSNEEDTPLARARQAAKLSTEQAGEQGLEALKEQPVLLVFEEDHADSIHTKIAVDKLDEEARKSVDEHARQISGEDGAVYCFSSGTSGLPKAVMLSHHNLVCNTIQASFLLYDRMNRAADSGERYSADGKTGWYDKAEEKGAGKELRTSSPSADADPSGSSKTGSAKGLRKLAVQIRKSLNLGESKKNDEDETNEQLQPPPSGYRAAEDGMTGFSRIESRPKGEQEFHIDVLPQFHCYGLLVNLVAIHTITPRIILPRFHLQTYLASVQRYGITFGFVVPPILLALAKHPMVDQYDVSTLWRVASGAASLPDEIANAVKSRLGILCTDGYGMTEMSPIVAMQTLRDVQKAPNTVGVLAPNTEAMVVNEQGDQVSFDQQGELLLRGPQMMQGYLRNDEANENAFHTVEGQKWLRTGDVVKIDKRGYITITDRLKDVIKAKGFQVSPAELEAILFKDARIQDAAVIGTKDPKDGSERPWAFLVSHQKFSEDEKKLEEVEKSILSNVNEQVAGYKKIAGITWLDALPKSDAGKVLKKNLTIE